MTGFQRLRVHSDNEAKPIIDLIRNCNGEIVVQSVSIDLKQMVDDWLNRGLRELISEDGISVPRLTLSTEPEFLERLAANVERQTRFLRVHLERGKAEDGETP